MVTLCPLLPYLGACNVQFKVHEMSSTPFVELAVHSDWCQVGIFSIKRSEKSEIVIVSRKGERRDTFFVF